MKSTQNIINYIKGQEGYALVPYWDSKGWSVGYGHFLGGVKTLKPSNISKSQVDLYFLNDIANVEAAINKFCLSNKITLTQNQFDALVDFGFNAGVSRPLQVLRYIAAKDYLRAAAYVNSVVWSRNNKTGIEEKNPTLMKRRAYELQLLNFPVDEKKKSENGKTIIVFSVLFVIILIVILKYKKII